MQFEVQKLEENLVRFALKDASTTILEPIIEELNKDETVVFARYIVDHPDLTDPVLEVKVSSGSPVRAIRDAADRVAQTFRSISIE